MSEILERGSGLTSWLMTLLTFLAGCSGMNEEGLLSFPGESRLVTAFDSAYARNYNILVPETTLDMFACIDCHKGLKVNTTKRVLTQTHKDFVFDHPGFDRSSRWCYYCHYTGAFDKLVLEDGKLLDYKDSYLLCQQCHLGNFREWELGIHGKRTGEWKGTKQNMSCTGCHNSHTPAISQQEPKKPPLQPEQILIILNK